MTYAAGFAIPAAVPETVASATTAHVVQLAMLTLPDDKRRLCVSE